MSEPNRRSLAAIVAADVAGFSRLIGEDEEGTLAALRALRRDVVEPLLAAHGGRIANTAGDSYLLDFSSTVEAVRFAQAMQQAVAERRPGGDGSLAVRYRVGVHVGDVLREGGDLLGDGVNVAARLEAMAEPGGICVSQTVVDHVRGKSGIGFRDLGPQRLKNIAEPVTVFRVTSGVGDLPAMPSGGGRVRRPRKMFLGVLAVALVLAAGLALWQRPWEPQIDPASEARMAFPLPDKPSIAVLPFNDLSEDASQEFFADGITEDLITDLSKVSGLFVIARNSSFSYKGKPVTIAKVSEELGVRFVLEGSVRRSGSKLRVNAQLVDATTGGQRWADRFDGETEDIFEVQDTFVQQIIAALELTLTAKEQDEIERTETVRVAAKEAFQKGWDLYSRFNEEDNARAVAFFEKAIEIDPNYGRAYGALALVYLRGSIFHWEAAMGENRATLYRERVPAALAKASEHGTALVHVVRAMKHLFYRAGVEPEGPNRGTDDARREASLAIALQPSDPEAHITMGWALIAAGRAQEGLSFVEAAMRLNPNYPSHYVFFQAAAHAALNDLETAARILSEGIERDPHATDLAPLTAAVHGLLGQRAAARKAIAFWLPGADQPKIEAEIAEYAFPVRWVDSQINRRLQDGLRLAALPLETTVESLTAELQQGDVAVRAIRTIGWFGSAAAPAVPALMDLLSAENKLIRKKAIIALGKIGPAAAPAIPLLEPISAEPLIGYHAREALARIAPE